MNNNETNMIGRLKKMLIFLFISGICTPVIHAQESLYFENDKEIRQYKLLELDTVQQKGQFHYYTSLLVFDDMLCDYCYDLCYVNVEFKYQYSTKYNQLELEFYPDNGLYIFWDDNYRANRIWVEKNPKDYRMYSYEVDKKWKKLKRGFFSYYDYTFLQVPMGDEDDYPDFVPTKDYIVDFFDLKRIKKIDWTKFPEQIHPIIKESRKAYFGKDDYSKADYKKLADSLIYVQEVPYILDCYDTVLWKIVGKGKDIVPFLIEKMTDTRVLKGVTVRFYSGEYTVADVAHVALREIIGDIPTFELLGVPFNEVCGECSYWWHVRASKKNRKKFQSAVKKWYNENKANLVWVEDLQAVTGDCFSPAKGHYEVRK